MASPRRPRPDRASLRLENLEDRTTPNSTSVLAQQIAAGAIEGGRVTVVMNNVAAGPTVLQSTPYASSVRSLGLGMYSVNLAPGTDLGTALAFYGKLPGVGVAEPDQIMHALTAPNDPMYAAQYGPSQIGAQAVWSHTTGNQSFVVGVIDTGVDYTHPDLAENIWLNQKEIPAAIRARLADVDGDGLITFLDLNNAANIGAGKITDLNRNGYIDGGDILQPLAAGGWADGIDQDGNGFVDDLVGWDFANGDNDPMDDNSHGTHVSGTIGAIGGDGLGVTGINWHVQVMGLKFLAAGGFGATSDAIAAINYAVMMGVKITNNSWGGQGPSDPALARAISATQTSGQIFVVAAGNSYANNDQVDFFPTNYSLQFNNVVAVAATDNMNRLASFSDYGVKSVTLAAPGVNVFSTFPGGTYGYDSGTSMASPHVAGALALYWGANPGLNYLQVINRLKSTVDPVLQLQGMVSTGGRLNVANMFGLSATPPIVVGAPAGSEIVRVLAPGGATQLALDPYAGFLGGVQAAAGDVTGDGVADVVTAATLGGHVKLFDGTTGALLRSFYAFPGYVGPISVAVGDLSGDGVGDIIVAANLNGHVKVFDGATGAMTFSQLLYDGYHGAVEVSAADIDGDGRNELVTAASGAGGVHIKEFGAAGLQDSFLATGPNEWPDFSISASDLDLDGVAELLVSQGPRVQVLNSRTHEAEADFLAFDPLTNSPIQVQAARYTGGANPQVVAVLETGGRAQVRVFTGPDYILADSFIAGTR